ncbi:MAG: hypothetical protein ACPGOY_14775 [Rhodospirillaceae bacterium]
MGDDIWPDNVLSKGASGELLPLVGQMLRLLVGVAMVDPKQVETQKQRRSLFRSDRTCYATAAFHGDLSGPLYSEIIDYPEIKQALEAEEIALALFDDMFFGGGCGEEPCCGPTAIWWKSHQGSWNGRKSVENFLKPSNRFRWPWRWPWPLR